MRRAIRFGFACALVPIVLAPISDATWWAVLLMVGVSGFSGWLLYLVAIEQGRQL